MKKQATIVLIWIWWTGMSGVAGMFLDLWYENIVGIDSEHSQLTDRLESRWLTIIYGHGNYTVQWWDIVIYSAAAEESPEVQQAIALLQTHPQGMLVCNYFQFLGEISKHCQTLAIAGTNGKSTTTALALYAAREYLPTLWIGILGALLPDFGNQSYYISPDAKDWIKNIFDHILTGKWLDYDNIKKYHFIVEACEYKRHFLHLDPDYTVITSLELDHTDYYKDMADYKNAFVQLIDKTKQKIWLAPAMDTKRIPEQYHDKCQVVDFQDINTNHVFGEHYRINTSLLRPALQSMWAIWIDNNSRADFHGLWRRMEYLGSNKQWASIYTDYAHMPSSLDIVYQALHKQFPDKKICAVFQPHQVHRILQSREEFWQALRQYDVSILYNIYAARESADKIYENHNTVVGTVNDIGHTLAKDIGARYILDFAPLWETIQSYNDERVIVILTAGDLDYYVRNTIQDK